MCTSCCRRCTSIELQYVSYCSAAHCNCWSLIHDIYKRSLQISSLLLSGASCPPSVSILLAGQLWHSNLSGHLSSAVCYRLLKIEIENKHLFTFFRIPRLDRWREPHRKQPRKIMLYGWICCNLQYCKCHLLFPEWSSKVQDALCGLWKGSKFKV